MAAVKHSATVQRSVNVLDEPEFQGRDLEEKRILEVQWFPHWERLVGTESELRPGHAENNTRDRGPYTIMPGPGMGFSHFYEVSERIDNRFAPRTSYAEKGDQKGRAWIDSRQEARKLYGMSA